MALHKHTINKIIGYLMYAVAVITPLSNLPQITQLYQTKVTTGLSITTWTMYLLFGLVPLTYALLHRIRPLIISNILWVVVEVIMLYGIISFGRSPLPYNYENLLLINTIGKTITGLGLIAVSSACALLAYDILDLRKKLAR